MQGVECKDNHYLIAHKSHVVNYIRKILSKHSSCATVSTKNVLTIIVTLNTKIILYSLSQGDVDFSIRGRYDINL